MKGAINMKNKENLEMVNANERKQVLCGWLKNMHPKLYESPLKLQKFLFFYECFSKVKGEKYDFINLKGYEQGPVFSAVYGDYTKDREEFDNIIVFAYKTVIKNPYKINVFTAQQCAFMCGSMTNQEISDLTHSMDIWKAKEELIKQGKKQIPLDENDFSLLDENLIRDLIKMYNQKFINGKTIVNVENKYFVFSQEDAKKLTETHKNTLHELVRKYPEELLNPVVAKIEDGGICIID